LNKGIFAMEEKLKELRMVELNSRLKAFAFLILEEIWAEKEEDSFKCSACGKHANKGILAIEYTSTRGLALYPLCPNCLDKLVVSVTDIGGRLM